jgi:hypothetical protein
VSQSLIPGLLVPKRRVQSPKTFAIFSRDGEQSGVRLQSRLTLNKISVKCIFKPHKILQDYP